MNRLVSSRFVQTGVIVCCLFAIGLPAFATSRYVRDSTGSDTSNNCSNSTAPCKTIARAVNQSSCGDTIHIHGDSGHIYVETVTVSSTFSCSSGTRLTIQNWSGTGTVKLQYIQWNGSALLIDNADYITVSGLLFDQDSSQGNGIKVANGSTFVTIQSNTFRDAHYEGGIWIADSTTSDIAISSNTCDAGDGTQNGNENCVRIYAGSNLTIDSNSCSTWDGACVASSGGSGTISNNTMSNIGDADSGDNPIIVNQASGSWTITGNTISTTGSYSGARDAIEIRGGIDSTTITSNSISSCGSSGSGIYIWEAGTDSHSIKNNRIKSCNAGIKLDNSDNNTVESNTLYGNAYGLFVQFQCTAVTVKNNIFSNNTSYGVYVESGPTLTRSYNLYYSNTTADCYLGGANCTVATDITGSDPLFLNTTNFYLKSRAGHYPFGNYDYDTTNSPAIDAGDSSSSCSSEPEPNGPLGGADCVIEIGRWGNTAYASKSAVAAPTVTVGASSFTFTSKYLDTVLSTSSTDFLHFSTLKVRGGANANIADTGNKMTSPAQIYVKDNGSNTYALAKGSGLLIETTPVRSIYRYESSLYKSDLTTTWSNKKGSSLLYYYFDKILMEGSWWVTSGTGHMVDFIFGSKVTTDLTAHATGSALRDESTYDFESIMADFHGMSSSPGADDTNDYMPLWTSAWNLIDLAVNRKVSATFAFVVQPPGSSTTTTDMESKRTDFRNHDLITPAEVTTGSLWDDCDGVSAQCDGFESNSLNAWDTTSTDSGDLAVSSSAEVEGAYGLLATVDDTNAIYVEDTSPPNDKLFRLRFYLNADNLTMATNDEFDLVPIASSTGNNHAYITLLNAAGSKSVKFWIRDDSWTWSSTSAYALSAGWNRVEIDMGHYADANNWGFGDLYLNGSLKESLANIYSPSWDITSYRIGATGGIDAGTSGSFYVDAIQANHVRDGVMQAGYTVPDHAYNLNASSDGVTFTLDGSSNNRWHPAIKVRGYRRRNVPRTLTIGGSTKYLNSDYQAALIPFGEGWYEDNSTSTKIADGGDAADSDEYLNDQTNTYTFTGLSTSDTIYLGSLHKFTGVNVFIDTAGVGGTITWQYYKNGTWTTISSVSSTKTGCSNLTFDADSECAFYFDEPARWTRYTLTTSELGGSTSGQRELYWIRGTPASNYSTAPIVNTLQTDILIEQYLGTVTTAASWSQSSGPTVVTGVDFSGGWAGDGIALNWTTNSEQTVAGFKLWRAAGDGRVDSSLAYESPFDFLAAQYGASGGPYQVIDGMVSPGGIYSYYLEAIETTGESTWFGPVVVGGSPSVTPVGPGSPTPPTGVPAESHGCGGIGAIARGSVDQMILSVAMFVSLIGLLVMVRLRWIRRAAKRITQEQPVTITLANSGTVIGRTVNVSSSGLLVRLPVDLPIGETFTLILEGVGSKARRRLAKVVRKDRTGGIGLKFVSNQ